MGASLLRVATLTAVVAAIGFAIPPARAQDPASKKDAGTKDAPPAESQESIQKARELEKKLDAKNKLEATKAIEELGHLATHTAGVILKDFIHKTSNSEYGSYAVEALGWAGNKEGVDFLCGSDGARSGRLLIAEAACKALAKVGEKTAIPTLLEVIKSSKAVVTCAAIESVVQLDPGAEGLATLLAGMTGNSDDKVRMSVAEALGSLSSPKAVDALILMTKDQNSLVRMKTCKSLEKLAPAKARKALTDLMKDKNTEVRTAAEEALKRLPEPDPKDTGAPGTGK